MSNKKEFKVPNRKQPIFTIVKVLFKIFLRKPKIINLGDELQNRSIIVSNHSAKMGPLLLDFFFPLFCAKWGAHEMLGNYKARFEYLRNVYYIQKCGKKKFISTIRAGFEAIFSIYFYRGMKILPTYPDYRLTATIKHSCQVLDSDAAVMIFSRKF